MSRKQKPAPKKRGRPRSADTIVTSVRVPVPVYDRYCRQSNASGQDIRALMRWVLTTYAPPIWP